MSETQMNSERAENAPAPDVEREVTVQPPKSAEEGKEITASMMWKWGGRIAIPFMVAILAGVLWLINSPSKKDKETEAAGKGFNVELPSPTDGGLPSDKRTAYEREDARRREQEKIRNLQDFTAVFGGPDETQEQRAAREERQLRMAPKPSEYYENPERFERGGSSGARVNTLKASAVANDEINRQLGAWYEEKAAPAPEPIPSAVEERMSELERRLAEAETRNAEADEQTALLEKSYEMAARYNAGTPPTGARSATGGAAEVSAGQSGKAKAKPVSGVRKNEVSLLAAPMSDEEFIEAYSRPRNMGFLTAAGSEGQATKNTIRACVHRTVTLTDGKELPIRLTEPMTVDGILIPAGEVVTGSCRIEGERMDVSVTSIQYGGNIIPVELAVYGMDGQRGIAVPGNDEVKAMQEVASSLAQSAGTSITISDDAGSQLASDVGKGLIQGASQYASKKMGTVRVTVKANHALLLLPKTN